MPDDNKIERIKDTQNLTERMFKLMNERRGKGDISGDLELDQILSKCLMCKRDKRDESTEPCNYCKPRPNYPRLAPIGEIFVCGACGKTSKDLYGEQTGLGGWDESCMLNAVLCYATVRDELGMFIEVEGY